MRRTQSPAENARHGLVCSGGLELLFDNEKTLSLSVPTEDGVLTLNQLIVYIRDNCLKERPELFVADDSV